MGSSNLLPVLVSSLTVEQIPNGLSQPMVRVFLCAVLCSLISLEIMLDLGGLPQFPKQNVPKRDLFWNMAHPSNHSVPVVDEGSQIITGKLNSQEILNRVECTKFLIGSKVSPDGPLPLYRRSPESLKLRTCRANSPLAILVSAANLVSKVRNFPGSLSVLWSASLS